MRSKIIFLAFLFTLNLFSISCSSSVIQVRQSEANFELYVVVTPKDAVIYIDDEVYSTGVTSAETPLHVPAGTKRIEIRKEGYHPFFKTLEYVQPGQVFTLTTNLIQSEF